VSELPAPAFQARERTVGLAQRNVHARDEAVAQWAIPHASLLD
jgi:hypothetical protein